MKLIFDWVDTILLIQTSSFYAESDQRLKYLASVDFQRLLFYALVKTILKSIVRAITNFIPKFPHQCEQLHTQKIIEDQNYLCLYTYI